MLSTVLESADLAALASLLADAILTLFVSQLKNVSEFGKLRELPTTGRSVVVTSPVSPKSFAFESVLMSLYIILVSARRWEVLLSVQSLGTILVKHSLYLEASTIVKGTFAKGILVLLSKGVGKRHKDPESSNDSPKLGSITCTEVAFIKSG